MHRLHALLVAAICALAAVPAVSATAPPVGPLPAGPTTSVRVGPGGGFVVTLPKPVVAGGSWRIARAFDAKVVGQTWEHTTATGGVELGFAASGTGTTKLVFAVTRGETARAYASRTVRVTVGPGCPTLKALPADPLTPAIAVALKTDPAANRPQVTAAAIAPRDTTRGSQATTQCGSRVAARTVVVSIVDRALLPSQSASQRVVFVGRTSAGWVAWGRAH
jgi:hypothetical protein